MFFTCQNKYFLSFLLQDKMWYYTLDGLQPKLRKDFQVLMDIHADYKNLPFSREQLDELFKERTEIIRKPLQILMNELWRLCSLPKTVREKSFYDNFYITIPEILAMLEKPFQVDEWKNILNRIDSLMSILKDFSRSKRSSTLNISEVTFGLIGMNKNKIAMPGVLGKNNRPVNIHSIQETIHYVHSKTKPMKLSFRGDDGYIYNYLFKGMEDLHLDERMMQFLSIANGMMKKIKDNNTYRARNYSVIPLGARSGLIEWVEKAEPLSHLYDKNLYQKVKYLFPLNTSWYTNIFFTIV